ncbi:MAG TPA: hypothetical protein VIK05_14940 [Ilumatobacteraceae bacterium]|jgi:hypothetical protein
MGADQFETGPWPGTLEQAFNDAVDAANYEYGHRAYTGQINVKSGCTKAVLPGGLPEGMTPDRFFYAISSINDEITDEQLNSYPIYKQIKEDIDTLRTLVSAQALDNWYEIYDDKWGPALAIETPEGWYFGGYASS